VIFIIKIRDEDQLNQKMSVNVTRGKKSLLSMIFLHPEEDSDRLMHRSLQSRA
jgi:hypothetical protein